MADGRARRKQAEARGRRSETMAGLWLQLKGYRILARRVRLPVGEIDLVVQRGRVVAFIEVKARPTLERGERAVPPEGWRRINRAAESWMARRPGLAGLDWRFDLIVIRPRHLPAHLPDRWRPDFAQRRL